jgi:hypothetical protein
MSSISGVSLYLVKLYFLPAANRGVILHTRDAFNCQAFSSDDKSVCFIGLTASGMQFIVILRHGCATCTD